ncbi:MAG: hypothetical protein HRU06_11125 [Oceanospirillaceae bacterium]|nr:hypothetical protein [Oceanospirillaceae bacterium]
MSNQYQEEIVTTASGVVDIEYYKQEASRIRSEYLLALYRSAVSSIKGLFVTQKEVTETAANMFTVEKLAR